MAENAMTAAAAASSGSRGRLIEAHRLVRAASADRRGVLIIKDRRPGEVRTGTLVSIVGVLREWREIMPEISTAGYYREIAIRAGTGSHTVEKAIRLIIRALGPQGVTRRG